MFRIGIFESLLGKAADISLEVVVPLQAVDFDEDETEFESAESSEVLDLPLAVGKG